MKMYIAQKITGNTSVKTGSKATVFGIVREYRINTQPAPDGQGWSYSIPDKHYRDIFMGSLSTEALALQEAVREMEKQGWTKDQKQAVRQASQFHQPTASPLKTDKAK